LGADVLKVYTMATNPAMTTAALAPTTGAVVLHGGPQVADGVFYGGTLLYGASQPRHFSASPSSGSALEPVAHGTSPGTYPPRFYKLEFTTYDGAEDPLNWLNHCEQFFRGQRTLASDRTWLASYHLTGAA
jgi:hypothetical protein